MVAISMKDAGPALIVSVVAVMIVLFTHYVLLELLTLLALIFVWVWSMTRAAGSQSAIESVEQPFNENIRRELEVIAGYITQILEEETDYIDEHVQRIKTLIHDSTLLLQSSFTNIADKTSLQAQIAGELVAQIDHGNNNGGQHAANQVLEKLTATSTAINQEIDHSIRALQFEDIISQLSDHIMKRHEHINLVAKFSHDEVVTLKDEASLISAAEKLREMRNDFHQQNITEKVTQNSMEEGEVELF